MLLVAIDRFCRATRTTVQSHVRQGTVTLLGTGAAELHYGRFAWLLNRTSVFLFKIVFFYSKQRFSLINYFRIFPSERGLYLATVGYGPGYFSNSTEDRCYDIYLCILYANDEA